MGRGELHLGEGNYLSPLFRITDPFTSSIGSVVVAPSPVAMTTLRAGPPRFTSPPPFPHPREQPRKSGLRDFFFFLLQSVSTTLGQKGRSIHPARASLSLSSRAPPPLGRLRHLGKAKFAGAVPRGGEILERDSFSGGGIQASYGYRGPSWLLSGRVGGRRLCSRHHGRGLRRDRAGHRLDRESFGASSPAPLPLSPSRHLPPLASLRAILHSIPSGLLHPCPSSAALPGSGGVVILAFAPIKQLGLSESYPHPPFLKDRSNASLNPVLGAATHTHTPPPITRIPYAGSGGYCARLLAAAAPSSALFFLNVCGCTLHQYPS